MAGSLESGAGWARTTLCAIGLLVINGEVLAQQLGGGDPATVPVTRALLALVFCLLLAVAAAFALRRLFAHRLGVPSGSGGRREHDLRIVEQVRIAPNSTLSIVHCNGQAVLVGMSSRSGLALAPLGAICPAVDSAPGDVS